MINLKKLIYSIGLLSCISFTACGKPATKQDDSKFIPSDNPDENKKHFKDKKVIEENPYTSTPRTDNTPKVDNNGEIIISDPNESPETVVRTIIKAAKTKNYSQMLKLGNQAVKMDGDAKKICSIASESSEEQKSFNEYFSNAFIGEIRMKNNIAEVDITTTTKKGKDNETIIVEQKYGKWYLKGL